MTLNPGSKLGPYEIVAPLGAGGMGEVYHARDSRLARDVAIKVLPASLSSNAEIRARFEREAKTVSSLNHPNICVLHDVGREGDVDFLVMELIEGETLAQRLIRGALPTQEMLKIGAQIADALDRAHRAGVIHRDLKPGNIMLTRSGAKLLDFGLARATGLAGPPDGSGATIAALTQSPTIAEPLTAEGTILGTFQYMAPEQLEGQEADARSDLWALGCVLYEMATGQRAFEGKSQASLIGSIMHANPAPVSQVAMASPSALDRLIHACLAKDPEDRVQSAHDVRLQLVWMADATASTPGAVTPSRPSVSRRSRWIPFALIALATMAATALVMATLLRGEGGSGSRGTQRYIVGAENLKPSSAPALSPDGTTIVFSVQEGTTCRLFRRNLGAFEKVPIAGTEDGQAPFFSPDGEWIGFCTSDAIKKVPASGGVVQLVVSTPRPSAGDWARDGMIYFTPRAGGSDGTIAVARVPEVGGTVEVVASLDSASGEVEAWLPEILPDGKTVLYSTFNSTTSPLVAIRSDGTRQVVIENGFLGRYVEPGYLFYRDPESQAVLAAPFDTKQVRVTGAAVGLSEEVDGNYCFDVSATDLVYVSLPGAGEGDLLLWVDANGERTPATDTRASWTQPRISPDGRRVLLRKIAAECELWLLDLERGSLARLVQGDDNHDPIWSPDGKSIAFARMNAREMVTLTVEGPRAVTVIGKGVDHGQPQSWTSGLLAYTVAGRGTGSDIWVRAMDGSSPPAPFVATEFNEGSPSISPHGAWIAYDSNETGTSEVFLRRYPDDGTVWQISSGGGSSPLWSRDGGKLYFLSGLAMMAVDVDTVPEPRIGTPRKLFEGGFSAVQRHDFDVAADGRFLVVGQNTEEGQQQMRILLNWPDQLRRMSRSGR